MDVDVDEYEEETDLRGMSRSEFWLSTSRQTTPTLEQFEQAGTWPSHYGRSISISISISNCARERAATDGGRPPTLMRLVRQRRHARRTFFGGSAFVAIERGRGIW